jgi:hypothetical protein
MSEVTQMLEASERGERKAAVELLPLVYDDPGWGGQTHFFAAAAEAMRRILIENAPIRWGQPSKYKFAAPRTVEG